MTGVQRGTDSRRIVGTLNDSGMSATTRLSWVADDGIEIQFSLAGRATGRPVILQHGFGTHGLANWAMSGVLPRLAAEGRFVVVPDARGHGGSGKPADPQSYGEGRMAVDLAGIADALRLTEFDLVGYSMGAVVAVLLAVRDPRVRRLVIGGIGEGAVACGGVDTRVVGTQVIVDALSAEDPSTVEGPGLMFRRLVDASGGDRRALAAQAAAAHQGALPLDAVDVPALVFAGRVDPLAVAPEVLAQAIGAELLLLDGDHLSVFQDPRLVDEISRFLSG